MIAAAERLARLRLIRSEGVGPVGYRKLLDRFGSAEAALDALPALARKHGRPNPPAIPDRDAMAREIDAVAGLGGRVLILGDADYPAPLAAIPDAPPALAVLGDPAALSRPGIGMVGARNASANGLRLAEALAADLAGHGFVVVSGLARGIDGAAHRGALHQGATVACIAGGLDQPYPPEHAALQAEIAARGGAVLAEAPLGTTPQSRHFPRRNRLIAGLSLGTVVIEAAPRSGSLITARMATDYGREVFAVPGSPLDPRCRGSNNLIREGAHLTETADDVLANLPAHARPAGFAEPPPNWGEDVPEHWDQLAQVHAAVLRLLSPTPTPVDDLVRRCQFSTSAVMAVLTELELGGRVETLPGNRVCLLG